MARPCYQWITLATYRPQRLGGNLLGIFSAAVYAGISFIFSSLLFFLFLVMSTSAAFCRVALTKCISNQSGCDESTNKTHGSASFVICIVRHTKTPFEGSWLGVGRSLKLHNGGHVV